MKIKQRNTAMIIVITLLLACNLYARKPLAILAWNVFRSWMDGLIEWRLNTPLFKGPPVRHFDFNGRPIEEDIEIMMGRRHGVGIETVEVPKELNSGVSN